MLISDANLVYIVIDVVVEWYLSHPNHWENYEQALEAHPTVVLQPNPMVL